MIIKQYIFKKNMWKRFFARYFDIFIYYLLIGITIGIFNITLPNDYIGGIIMVSIWIIIETFFLIVFGNTPGKALFKLKIINTKNTKKGISIFQAFLRSFIINILSGIPIINLIFFLYEYNQIEKNGITFYDEAISTQVYQFSKVISNK